MSRNIGLVSKCLTPLPPGGYWPDLLYNVYTADTVPAQPGFRVADTLGRSFRLVEVVEAITAGNMITYSATNVAIAATKFDAEPIGESVFNLDITTTLDAYAGGLLCLTEGTGAGYTYPILTHTAGTAGTSDCVLKIEGQVIVATSATDTVGYLAQSPWTKVTQHNAANPCVEAAIGRMMATTSTTNKYGWAQTWGPCLLKAGTGAVGAGDTIGLAEDDDGSVETLVTTEDPALVGISVEAIADGAFGHCILMLYP